MDAQAIGEVTAKALIVITLLSFGADEFLRRFRLVDVPWLFRFKWAMAAILFLAVFWSAVIYFGKGCIGS